VGAYNDDDNGEDSGSAYVFRYDGSSWIQEQKLTASDGAAYDKFGISAAVSGRVALVGAHFDDDNGTDSGSAYVFRYDGASWNQEQKLTAADGSAWDAFGVSVAVSGNVAAVGASYDDANGNDSGSAYVFRHDGVGWSQEQKLTAPDAAAYDHFGHSVAVSGDTAVVGAYYDDDNGADSGSAYIFRSYGAGWGQEQKLTASDGATEDRFGFSVAVSGNVAVVGADRDDDNGADSGSAYIFRYDGASWDEEQKLTASDGATEDYFGVSVAVSGDIAVVGAWYDDDNGSESGSAYVFRYDGASWGEEQKLTAPDGAAYDHFGRSVAVVGGAAVVGACLNDIGSNGNQGSAYFFKLVGDAKLTALDGAAGDDFGYSVAVSGNVAVVGAYYDDDNGSYSGSAYVFRHDWASWREEQKLTASDGAESDKFGSFVAVSGNVAVVGAYGDDDNGVDSGSGYVFRYDGAGWNQEQKLTALDGAAYDYFGYSVAASGNVAVVGAPRDGDTAEESGSVYVFRYDGASWNQEQKLTASDGATEDYFGYSAAVSGDVAVVGAPVDDDNGTDSGSGYVFRYDGASWSQEQKLTALDGAAYDYFGYSVAVSGNVAVVGAPRDSDNGTDSGSAYVFRHDGVGWGQEQKLTASDGATEDRFGYAAAVSGNTAVVGAYRDEHNGSQAGSAYVFRYDGASWSEEGKLIASDGAELDRFGYSVAVSGNAVVVGAPWDDDNGETSGSAYVYDLGVLLRDCKDGVDNDGDGLVDLGDFGCVDALDLSERDPRFPCDDGADNDGDGMIDFDPITFASPGDQYTLPSGSGDPGCHDPTWGTENPMCQDGVDNTQDSDGKRDYDAGLSKNGFVSPGPDPECVGKPWRNRECGLGAELALVVPALIWMRRRRGGRV
jgi:hypothetical protein